MIYIFSWCIDISKSKSYLYIHINIQIKFIRLKECAVIFIFCPYWNRQLSNRIRKTYQLRYSIINNMGIACINLQLDRYQQNMDKRRRKPEYTKEIHVIIKNLSLKIWIKNFHSHWYNALWKRVVLTFGVRSRLLRCITSWSNSWLAESTPWAEPNFPAPMR